MRYHRTVKYFFDCPNWLTNLLLGCVCRLIPVVGPMIWTGYEYEVLEWLHRHGDVPYPDFDFNRFLKYLMRGVWPFVVNLLVMLPALALGFMTALAAIIFLVSTTSSDDKESFGPTFIVALVLLSIFFNVLLFLASLIAVPMALRAGLAQQLAFAASWQFARDFLRQLGMRVVLAQLFMAVASLTLFLVGYCLCFVGMYPAMVIATAMQTHLSYQLYELYLQRGGTAIPLVIEAVQT